MLYIFVGVDNQEIEDVDIELELDLLEMLRANLVHAGVRVGSSRVVEDPWPAE